MSEREELMEWFRTEIAGKPDVGATVDAFLASDWLVKHDADIAAERLARVEALAREIEGGRTPWAYRLRAALADTAKEATT